VKHGKKKLEMTGIHAVVYVYMSKSIVTRSNPNAYDCSFWIWWRKFVYDTGSVYLT